MTVQYFSRDLVTLMMEREDVLSLGRYIVHLHFMPRDQQLLLYDSVNSSSVRFFYLADSNIIVESSSR